MEWTDIILYLLYITLVVAIGVVVWSMIKRK